MSPARPATVRCYFDADVLGLARVVASLRDDATYPGDLGATIKGRHRPPCPIADPAVRDDMWIPVVTALGWLIVTRDSRIQHHRAELAAVKASGARMIALGGSDAIGTWQQLEIVMRHWRWIEQLAGTPGPFIHTATRTSRKLVDLGP